MNLSNPKPVKTTLKQKTGFAGIIEKISALIGLVELGGGMAMPDKVNKQITPKQRDKIVMIIVLLIIYFILMGIFATFYFITKLF